MSLIPFAPQDGADLLMYAIVVFVFLFCGWSAVRGYLPEDYRVLRASLAGLFRLRVQSRLLLDGLGLLWKARWFVGVALLYQGVVLTLAWFRYEPPMFYIMSTPTGQVQLDVETYDQFVWAAWGAVKELDGAVTAMLSGGVTVLVLSILALPWIRKPMQGSFVIYAAPVSGVIFVLMVTAIIADVGSPWHSFVSLGLLIPWTVARALLWVVTIAILQTRLTGEPVRPALRRGLHDAFVPVLLLEALMIAPGILQALSNLLAHTAGGLLPMAELEVHINIVEVALSHSMLVLAVILFPVPLIIVQDGVGFREALKGLMRLYQRRPEASFGFLLSICVVLFGFHLAWIFSYVGIMSWAVEHGLHRPFDMARDGFDLLLGLALIGAMVCAVERTRKERYASSRERSSPSNVDETTAT